MSNRIALAIVIGIPRFRRLVSIAPRSLICQGLWRLRRGPEDREFFTRTATPGLLERKGSDPGGIRQIRQWSGPLVAFDRIRVD